MYTSNKPDSKYHPHNVMGCGLRVNNKLQLFDSLTIYIHNEQQTTLVEYWLQTEPEHFIKALWSGKLLIEPEKFIQFALAKPAHTLLMKELKANHPELYEKHLLRKNKRFQDNKVRDLNSKDGKFRRVVKVKPRVSLKKKD